MADEEKNWSDIQDEAPEGGFGEKIGGDEEQGDPEFSSGEGLQDNMSEEELSSLAGDMGGEGAQPDPNRPRFGERLGDEGDSDPDSDMNYDTERM